MIYFTTSSLFRLLKKASLFIVALLFSLTGLKAQEAIYLKNHWTNDYIFYGTRQSIRDVTPGFYMSNSERKTLWYIERVDDNYVLLKNKDGLYLNVEKGYLEASNVPPGFFSAHWKLTVTDGYNLIINRWTGVYIHNQNGKLEASAGNAGWWSAQWTMEDKDGKPLVAKDFSLNAYTTFLPNQQQYYKLENVQIVGNPVFLDIDKKKSTDLITVNDYGGDNGGKAWKFTLVADGWYKISNLKLGGNKVLAIAKNTDGSYYLVLTDFANYPNQLWRMIEFKDPVLLSFYNDKKPGTENLQSSYYTLVSKQHGLEAIKAIVNTVDNLRLLKYGLASGLNYGNPFDLFWRPQPVSDLALLRNTPLNSQEQSAFVKASVENTMKIVEDATLKATPIAVSPFSMPKGHIKGEASLSPVTTGRGDLSVLANSDREYTQEEWDKAASIAGKIPMALYNNTNADFTYFLRYTDASGNKVEKRYIMRQGKNAIFYMDPLDTYITITGYDEDPTFTVYQSAKYYRSKAVKIYLDGTKDKVKETVWNW